jgi:hypothetical protein
MAKKDVLKSTPNAVDCEAGFRAVPEREGTDHGEAREA